MSKYTQKRIAEISALTMTDIPAAIDNGVSVEEYLNRYRMTLNLTIIQAIFGAEFAIPKKEGKNYQVKFKHKLANSEEIAMITRAINDFIANVEAPFLSENAADVFENADDDMSIPTRVGEAPSIPALEKVNNKKIYEYIFGDEGVSKMILTGMDVIELAAVAEKIKKTKNRNTMLLIGGIALVVTGGAIATVCVVKSRKRKNSVEDAIEDVDIDMDNVPEIDMDDVPVVDMDDAPVVELD
jgi:hypothetical protein